MQLVAPAGSRNLDPIQRFALTIMSVLVLFTFVGANMQALLWQASDWLVSTVLPAVVIDLTNDERVDNAAPALRRNPTLDAAAAAKAQHMADNEYFAHFAPDGTTPWDFFDESGYVYAHAGENLAIHFTDSAEVVDAWMKSPAHRKNIVDRKFQEIGVGTARGTFDGYNTVYVVQLFGTPAVPLPAAPESVPAATELALAVEADPVIEVVPEVLPTEIAAPESPVVTETAAESVVETEVISEPVVIEVAEVPVVIESEVIDTVPEPVAPVLETSFANDVLVVETELATSSGLAVATMIEPEPAHAGATIASLATRPNLVLQSLYGALAVVVILSLLYALVLEWRRLHYVQVAYSLALLAMMGGLWFVHTTLTGGAIIA